MTTGGFETGDRGMREDKKRGGAEMSGRSRPPPPLRMRKQVTFAMVFRYCPFGWLQGRRPGDFDNVVCRGPVTACVDFSLGKPWSVRVGMATFSAPGPPPKKKSPALSPSLSTVPLAIQARAKSRHPPPQRPACRLASWVSASCWPPCKPATCGGTGRRRWRCRWWEGKGSLEKCKTLWRGVEEGTTHTPLVLSVCCATRARPHLPTAWVCVHARAVPSMDSDDPLVAADAVR
jgi:hypothetical protein